MVLAEWQYTHPYTIYTNTPTIPHTHTFNTRTHTHIHAHTILVPSYTQTPYHNMYHSHTHTHTQYPLKADDYKDVINEIKAVADAHKKSVGTLPPAQLDPEDITAKNAPCCNHDTDCTCSQPPN